MEPQVQKREEFFELIYLKNDKRRHPPVQQSSKSNQKSVSITTVAVAPGKSSERSTMSGQNTWHNATPPIGFPFKTYGIRWALTTSSTWGETKTSNSSLSYRITRVIYTNSCKYKCFCVTKDEKDKRCCNKKIDHPESQSQNLSV